MGLAGSKYTVYTGMVACHRELLPALHYSIAQDPVVYAPWYADHLETM
jgi:hypothetical protein